MNRRKIAKGERHGCFIHWFYSTPITILSELEGLSVFIITGHNLNNIRYAVLIADTEKQWNEIFGNVVIEKEKKGLLTLKGEKSRQKKGQPIV